MIYSRKMDSQSMPFVWAKFEKISLHGNSNLKESKVDPNNRKNLVWQISIGLYMIIKSSIASLNL